MKKMMEIRYILTVGLCFVFLQTAVINASIVYVDANMYENVTINGEEPNPGVNCVMDGPVEIGVDKDDGLWDYRGYSTNQYSQGRVWAAWHDDGETDPLEVTIVLPEPGKYRIYGLHAIKTGTSWDDWNCGYSLDGVTYTRADKTNTSFEENYWLRDSGLMETTGSDTIGYPLGLYLISDNVVTTTENEEIIVYAKALDPLNIYHDERTQFDGLGYELVMKAINPTPTNGAVDIAIDTTLSWDMSVDNVTGHYLYINDDPNMANVTPVYIDDVTNPVEAPVALNSDSIYYWRVDEEINSTDIIEGDTWSFTTVFLSAEITSQPQSTAGNIGDTVSLSIEAVSPSSISYTWYKSDDAVISENDETVGSNSSIYEKTLAESDEAYYYCKLENDSTVIVYSQVVEIVVKELLAHYKFEQNTLDYAGSNGGTVIDGEFNSVTPTYVTGVIDSYGIDLTDDDTFISLPVTSYPNLELGGGFRMGTVSAWVKPSEVNGTDYIMSNWVDGSNTGFAFGLSDDSNIILNLRQDGGSNIVINGGNNYSLADDQWHHVAATYFVNGACALYLDGILVGSDTSNLDSEQLSDWVYTAIIGAARSLADREQLGSYLFSELDDLRIYNYALTQEDIADLYLMGPSDSVCIYNYGSEFDTNSDCKVTLIDFRDFASKWLSCGLYPISVCD